MKTIFHTGYTHLRN